MEPLVVEVRQPNRQNSGSNKRRQIGLVAHYTAK